MTLAEFLAWEERQAEFDGVRPVAMTGGTRAHATVQANLAIVIGGRLRGGPCRFYGSDLKIKTGDDHIRYPTGPSPPRRAKARARWFPTPSSSSKS
jgi:Putative restriction endonuclease